MASDANGLSPDQDAARRVIETIDTLSTKAMSKIWTSLGKFKSQGMRRRPASLSGQWKGRKCRHLVPAMQELFDFRKTKDA
ncbi:hypothetical protein ACC668_20955 [Rhizobium ruizarguesonis]